MKRFLTGSNGFGRHPADTPDGHGAGRDAATVPAPPAWPMAQMVRDYWEALKVGGRGALPRRSAIDPRTIAPALHSVFLASRVTMGLVRIRIGGTTLANLAGIEVMDMPLSLLFMPEARPQLALAVERVLADGAIATLDLVAECSPGREELAARLVLLPLAAMDDASTMVLGCLDCNRPVSRQSRRFAIIRSRIEAGVAPASATAAEAHRPEQATTPNPAPVTLAPSAPGGSSLRSAPAMPGPLRPDGRKRPGYLRLVHSV